MRAVRVIIDLNGKVLEVWCNNHTEASKIASLYAVEAPNELHDLLKRLWIR